MGEVAKFVGYLVLALMAIGAYANWQDQQVTAGDAPVPAALADDGTGLRVCNKSTGKASVALGQLEAGTWTTRGWEPIEPGQCKGVANGISGNTYYLYATGENGVAWSGDHNLCIHPQKAFVIKGFENCETRNYRSVGFTQIVAERGTTTLTQNLTNRKTSKLDRLDIGERVYVQGFLEDELVTVVRIDKSDNTVKVQRSSDGTMKWVNASEVITREESVANDVGRVAVGATLLICLFSPESCR